MDNPKCIFSSIESGLYLPVSKRYPDPYGRKYEQI